MTGNMSATQMVDTLVEHRLSCAPLHSSDFFDYHTKQKIKQRNITKKYVYLKLLTIYLQCIQTLQLLIQELNKRDVKINDVR